MMEKIDIKSRLPHRDAMLLVGEVLIERGIDGELAVGKTVIRGDEWYLQGHFPDEPVVPGVILCEIMAQSVCALVSCEGHLPYFSGMKNVKWRSPVRPGDTFVTECRIEKNIGRIYFVRGIGYVIKQGQESDCKQKAVEAELSFALVPRDSGGDNA